MKYKKRREIKESGTKNIMIQMDSEIQKNSGNQRGWYYKKVRIRWT